MTRAQAKTIQEERKALLAEEHANIEKLLSTISASVNRDLPQRLEELLKAQLGTLPPLLSPAALQPAVQAALATTLPAELAGSALQVLSVTASPPHFRLGCVCIFSISVIAAPPQCLVPFSPRLCTWQYCSMRGTSAAQAVHRQLVCVHWSHAWQGTRLHAG